MLKLRPEYVEAYRSLAWVADQPCLGFNCCCVVLLFSLAYQKSHLSLADKYAVRFIPHENGIHSIDVKFNGSHVVGSPFKVRVGEPGQAGNPALVTAYGSGLESGTTGNLPFTALIQTCLHFAFLRETEAVARLIFTRLALLRQLN